MMLKCLALAACLLAVASAYPTDVRHNIRTSNGDTYSASATDIEWLYKAAHVRLRREGGVQPTLHLHEPAAAQPPHGSSIDQAGAGEPPRILGP